MEAIRGESPSLPDTIALSSLSGQEAGSGSRYLADWALGQTQSYPPEWGWRSYFYTQFNCQLNKNVTSFCIYYSMIVTVTASVQCCGGWGGGCWVSVLYWYSVCPGPLCLVQRSLVSALQTVFTPPSGQPLWSSPINLSEHVITDPRHVAQYTVLQRWTHAATINKGL